MNTPVIANEVTQSMSPDCMDCRATLSMNSPVIANAVKQSMSPEVMDRHASLAMTKSLFKARVRYRARFRGLAVTVFFSAVPAPPW